MRKAPMKKTLRGLGVVGLFAIALLYSFPILYMVFSSFKPEQQIAPPSLSFTPTLENYETVINADLLQHLGNSIVVTVGTVILTLLLGVPIAYTIVFGKLRNPTGHFNWYITTTLLPAVAVIIPLYLIMNWLGVLDSALMLIVLYTSIGIPLMVWMSTTYMSDVPISILEAAQIDGCTRWQAFMRVILPIIKGGLISTALLVFITTWNEFLFAVSFTFTEAGTLPVYMNRFMTQQGLFWGKMSAVATIAIIIPVILGFVAQKSLIKGLLSGAVKE
ncbi:MAG: carbohydrate ABC transporter permease [Microbacterium sp.]